MLTRDESFDRHSPRTPSPYALPGSRRTRDRDVKPEPTSRPDRPASHSRMAHRSLAWPVALRL